MFLKYCLSDKTRVKKLGLEILEIFLILERLMNLLSMMVIILYLFISYVRRVFSLPYELVSATQTGAR